MLSGLGCWGIFIIILLIAAFIYWAVTYALDNLTLPDPIPRFGRVVVTIVLALWLFLKLLSCLGGAAVHLP